MAVKEQYVLDIEVKLTEALQAIKRLENEIRDLQSAGDDIEIRPEVDDSEVQRLENDLDDLAGDSTEVEIEAEADDAERTISDLIEDVERLDSADATIALALTGAEIQQEISDLLVDIARLDTSSADVEVKAERIAELRGDLDQLTTKIREIDAASADVTVTADTSQVEGGLKRTKQGLDDTRASSDQTKSVMANMAGNTAQDLGELGGVVGSLGVGIGQLAEYATEGNISLSQLSKLAGPVGLLAAVSVGVGLFQKWKAAAAELAENTRQATEAFEQGVGSIDEWTAAVDAAFDTGTAGADAFSREILRALEKALSPEQVVDLRVAMSNLGLTFEDLTGLVDTAATDFASYAASQLEAAGASEGVASAVGLLTKEYGGADDILTDLNDRLDHGVVLLDQYGNEVPVDEALAFVEANEGLINSLDEIEEGFNRVDIESAAQKFLQLERSVDPATRAMVNAAIAATRNADGTIDYTAALGNYIERQQEAARAEQQRVAQMERQRDALDEIGDAYRAAGVDLAEFERRRTAGPGDAPDTIHEMTVELSSLREETRAVDAAWAELMERQYSGTLRTKEGAAAWEFLRKELELSPEAMAALMDQKYNEFLDEQKQLALDAAAAHEELALAVEQASAEMGTAESRAAGWASAIEQLDAVSEIDLSQRILEWKDSISGIGTALDDARDAGVDFSQVDMIPDTWEDFENLPDEMRPVIEAFAGARDQIQQEMGRAFEGGGAPEARIWAENTRTHVANTIKALGLDVNTETALISQAWSAMGITDQQVEITIEIAQKQQLLDTLDDITSSIDDIPPSTRADIEMAINNGDPDTALRILNQHLRSIGEDEIELEFTSTDDSEQVGEDYDAAAEDRDLEVEGTSNADEIGGDLDSATVDRTTQVIVPKSDSLGQMQELLDYVARARTVNFNAKSDNAGAIDGILNGIAADRNSDIWVRLPNASDAERSLNNIARDRSSTLTVYTRQVGSTSSSGRSTTTAAAGVATMEAPTATAAPSTVHYHTSINAGVIGNRFDVDRTVAQALRRWEHRNGRRR